MAVSPEVAARMLSALESVRPITSRKMFGGVGIYCDGTFFAVIDDDRLFFKWGPSNEALFDEVGAEQWFIPQGPMPYREVPESILMDQDRLGEWIDAAIDVAQTKKAKKPNSR
jgi:DNA transformation protein